MSLGVLVACGLALIVVGLLFWHGGFGLVKGGVIIAVILGFLILAIVQTVNNASRNSQATAWPITSGVIVSSTVARFWETESDGPGYHVYRPKITYRYQVGDEKYESSTITTSDSSGSYESAHPVKWRYQEGAEVTVYVDPDDASQSLLEPGNKIWYMSGFTLVVVGIMITVVVASFFSVFYSRPER